MKIRHAGFALALLFPLDSIAAEVQFEGYYRARGRAFDTLSLDRTLIESEGSSVFFQHRLWLKPKFLISENVSIMTEFRGLDNVPWGTQVYPAYDYVNQQATVLSLNDSLSAPTSITNAETGLVDFTLWRTWAEIFTPIGRISFGRMPLHWGAGIWQNNGLGPLGEYGDSADRIQWQHLIDDQVFLQAAIDANVEGYLNQSDDTTSYNLALALQRERVFSGINMQLRTTPSLDFNLFTADLSFTAEMGQLTVMTEVVGQFGGGDLNSGLNQVRINALGGVLGLDLDANPWSLSLQGGFATGDSDPTDEKIKTFSFDRDYNLGLMLFERPMPVLAAASANELNGGSDYDLVQTGDRISNAIFVHAMLGRELVDNLDLQLQVIGARAAKLPDSEALRKGYGLEFDLGVSYQPYEQFNLRATGGLFLPGSRFSEYSDDDYDGFEAPAFGAQLVGTVSF